MFVIPFLKLGHVHIVVLDGLKFAHHIYLGEGVKCRLRPLKFKPELVPLRKAVLYSQLLQ